MKKTIALTLVILTVCLLALSGCGAASTKSGVGVVTSIAKSADFSEEKSTGTAQVDSIVASVTLDSNNKIVDIDIDSAQTKVLFDATGKITSDKAAEIKSKRELGNDYGMKKSSGIGKEWFEQIDALQAWMKGKTVEQVKAIKTKEVEGKVIADEADLTSSVTIGIADYLAAFEKAVANAK